MNSNTKNWLTGILAIITLVGGIVFYIYAEATASRDEDKEIRIAFGKEDKEIRKELRDDRKEQMALLHSIDKKTIRIQAKLGIEDND